MSESPQPPVIFLAFAREDISHYEELPRLPDEQKQLRALLDPVVRAGRCELVERPAVTLDEILGIFQDERYRNRIAVFHFADRGGPYCLLLEERTGTPLAADAGAIAAFLARRLRQSGDGQRVLSR